MKIAMIEVPKNALRGCSPSLYRRLRRAYIVALSRARSNNLTALAEIHGTDKWGYHWYTPHYARHFGPIRHRRLKILEIGVGGYEDPNAGGASLRAWKYYFPRSEIYALDLYDKSPLQEDRIRIFQGSQNDPDVVRDVVREMRRVDIVIDDGSHVNEHVLTSFRTLFPLLETDGIYVIEDTQRSYWPDFGGDSYDLNNPSTMMTFLKGLIDGLNYEEIARKGYEPTYFDKNITALHFYHNLAFVYKGRNAEGSDMARNRLY